MKLHLVTFALKELLSHVQTGAADRVDLLIVWETCRQNKKGLPCQYLVLASMHCHVFVTRVLSCILLCKHGGLLESSLNVVLQVPSTLCGSDKNVRRKNFVFAVFSLGWMVKNNYTALWVLNRLMTPVTQNQL